MEKDSLSSYYSSRKNNYHNGTDLLKLLLMPFVFVALLGLPGKIGGYITMYCNFVVPTFFILFGFFTLVPDEVKRVEKLQKAGRSALKLFVIMLVANLVLNLIYLAMRQSLNAGYLRLLFRKRALFDFLVLNIWPLHIGNGIWFVQSLLYAYLFFLFAEKTKISRFYLPILIVLTLLMICTGELAPLCGFPYFWYNYIPANFLTRAIPYMLIGMFLRKHVDMLTKIPKYGYVLIFVAGLMASIAEINLLQNLNRFLFTGHVIGFGLMSLSLCGYVLAKPFNKRTFLSLHGNNYSRRMYAFCQPVAFLAWLIARAVAPQFLGAVVELGFFVSFVVSFFLAWLVGVLKDTRFLRELRRLQLFNVFDFRIFKRWRHRRRHRHRHHHNTEKNN